MTGNYTFHIACDDECELWFDESGISSELSIELENNAKMIAKLDRNYPVDHNEWFR